ncbi:MAG TPA: CRISPR-associated protein Csx19, partial [Micromonospora sp.]
MNTIQGAALHAVRATDHLTATDAIAWFAPPAPSRREVIGYTFSARSATWLRVGSDGTITAVGTPGDPLAEAYEMVLFDGERELRWLRTPDGRGPAIALGEDRSALPLGTDVFAEPLPRRGPTQTRLLAGVARPHDTAGWTTLASDRYASVPLPVPFTDGTTIAIETVEYVVEDEHGNLDV